MLCVASRLSRAAERARATPIEFDHPTGPTSRPPSLAVRTARRGGSGITRAPRTSSPCGSRGPTRAGTPRCAIASSEPAAAAQPAARRSQRNLRSAPRRQPVARLQYRRVAELHRRRTRRAAAPSQYRRADGTQYTFAHEGARNTRSALDYSASARKSAPSRRAIVSDDRVRRRRRHRRDWRGVLGNRDRRSIRRGAIDRARRLRGRLSLARREHRVARVGRARCVTDAARVRRSRPRVFRIVLHRDRAATSLGATGAGQFRRRRGAAPLHVVVGHAGRQTDEAVDVQSERSADRRAGLPQLHLSGHAPHAAAHRRDVLDALSRPEPRRLDRRSDRRPPDREPLVRRTDDHRGV